MGKRDGGAVFSFNCVRFDLVDVAFFGGFGFCLSMRSGSPALTMLCPELIAQPSTPREPMYFLDHSFEVEGGVRLRGTSAVVVRVTKLFNVASTGRFPFAVLINPEESRLVHDWPRIHQNTYLLLVRGFLLMLLRGRE